MRSLAVRAADGARSTAGLLEQLVNHADDGVAVTTEARAMLETIARRVESAGAVVSTIAAGSAQQSLGIDEINLAVEQVNQVTQQSAATAEEGAAAAVELASQSDQLRAVVGASSCTTTPRARPPPLLPWPQTRRPGRGWSIRHATPPTHRQPTRRTPPTSTNCWPPSDRRQRRIRPPRFGAAVFVFVRACDGVGDRSSYQCTTTPIHLATAACSTESTRVPRLLSTLRLPDGSASPLPRASCAPATPCRRCARSRASSASIRRP
ncbi:MAG: hypothetical protein IPF47_14360 [Gemmatimonadetes bacterium]|nr:hypothetical protein [Gemmatimonadota bacterium]